MSTPTGRVLAVLADAGFLDDSTDTRVAAALATAARTGSWGEAHNEVAELLDRLVQLGPADSPDVQTVAHQIVTAVRKET